MMLGDKTEAKYSLEKALVIARETGDRKTEGRHLGSLGLMSEGQERIGYFDQALAIARAVGDRHGEISHLGCLGMAWFDKGQTAKKMPGVARISQNIIMRNMNRDGSLPKDLKDKLEEQDSSRCFQKAATYFEQAVAIAREISDYLAEGRRLGDLGEVLSEQGKIDRALVCYQQALAISLEMGDHQSEVRHLKHLRFAYLARGDTNEVHEIEKRLKEIAEDSGGTRTENILEMFGSKEVDPFHEEYWRVSREEDKRNYWSEYYQIHLAG
jgi:tetratricopeptide (TPR) repeat protein